ncbi:MAG: hypothetical protein DHS20C13_08850 [Thermodesulfobacteriota bacterium]|nr:MAG: hypothetical protein DHS20C13_08850 [Thermodesulfobacteriota bacterium]
MTKNLSNLAPPQNIEAEQAILGAILTNGTIVDKVIEKLVPEDFYKQTNFSFYDVYLQKQ